MTKQEYTNTQGQVMLICALIRVLPLAEFLDAISRAETIGPILDPTLYRQAGHKMETIKIHADALRQAQWYLEKWAPHPLEPANGKANG
jgi:hypothetical protein